MSEGSVCECVFVCVGVSVSVCFYVSCEAIVDVISLSHLI